MKLVWIVGLLILVASGCNSGTSGVETEDDTAALTSGTFVGSSSLVMFDTCGLGVTADDLNAMSVEVIVADRAIILDGEVTLDRANEDLFGITQTPAQMMADADCAIAIRETFNGSVLNGNEIRLIQTVDFLGAGMDCAYVGVPCSGSFSTTLVRATTAPAQAY